MEVTAPNGTQPKGSPISKALAEKQAPVGRVRTTIEGLAVRSWTPVRSLALRAQALLPFFPRAVLTMSDDRTDVTAELPGVDGADLDLSIEGRTLVIRGTKRMQRETNTKNCDRTERYHIAFARSVRVHGPVDRDTVGATLKNGVLQVHLPFATNGVSVSQRSKVPIATT
jgi:HSP20 family molecular chaperone IbpA